MGETGMIVREATREDLYGITALWYELAVFHEQYGEQYRLAAGARENYFRYLNTLLADPTNFLILAEEHGEVLGFCHGMLLTRPPIFTITRLGFISELGVRASRRRQGIGQALLRAILEWFEKNGVELVEIANAQENEIARNFWSSQGFVPYMERRAFWLNR
ncbi:Ribosomal protein S18 acetylase RimI [Carboxydocella sporoproducens DSM 16521]|uniref:Ribosomal protein S18 acetylase RimI n=3 Tax=Clostridiales Family XVI. Incertae Sedis TaxID=543347 RepID=A0A1T4MQM7_9FIRM|nr:Ribosomal protein S18 acetylase RimI [Carboxydocella thermautotrophica]AVX30802.1 Ribosomal protein S18 acetylase RimI [Carboxydocella thermautotrophica]SJZ69094.1 Ribosomal protein S18 acetylase RimI [Carboxydocella sporoproducens DSM 16521]